VFDSFGEELKTIRTNRFHVLTPITQHEIEAVREKWPDLPSDYIGFLAEFGNARLYKELSYYIIGVYLVNKPTDFADEEFLLIGHYDSDSVYFRIRDLENSLPNVYQGTSGHILQKSYTFEEWFVTSCRSAKKRYSSKEWKRILEGPRPFSQAELKILEARRRFQWSVVSVDEREWRFVVHNNSEITLSYLSIGYVSIDGKTETGKWLDVSRIGPGQSALITDDWSHWSYSPLDFRAVPRPDPQPEDRDRYWEFRTLSSHVRRR
jgi:hypothetical protein